MKQEWSKLKVILALIVMMGLSACASSPPSGIGDACRIFEQKRSWYRATHKAEKKWGMPKSLQLAIIRTESGFDRNARPPKGKFLFIFPGKRASSAKGFAQALDQTWETYKRDTGNRGANRKNFRDAADFVGWYGAQTRKRNDIALNDARNQYLAYHEGWGGYARGSWRGKTGVQAAASRVARNAATYQQQLSRCERKFKRGIPLIPFV